MTTLQIILAVLFLAFVAWVVRYCLFNANKPHWTPCSWCKGWYSEDGQFSATMPDDCDGVTLSHGICPKCAEKMEREFDNETKQTK